MSLNKSSLLPVNSEGFTSEEYWNTFFAKKTDGFEWYGEYNDLVTLLLKYMSEKDNILIVGCGNSDLGVNLHYAGLRRQVNIDISPVVIAQMAETYPFVTFKQDDVTNLSYPDENFTCVLDKGTYDALSPPPTREQLKSMNGQTIEEALQSSSLEPPTQAMLMLQEVKRVLKPQGRFICISLLQNHLAQTLFSFFHGEGWMIRVCRCHQAEQRHAKTSEGINFPVYMCVFTKMNLAGAAPIEYAGSVDVNAKVSRLGSLTELMNTFEEARRNAFMNKGMKDLGFFVDNDICINLCTIENKPRFLAYLVDIPRFFKNTPEKQFAFFIVPQGRECEYLFGTREGRIQLGIQSGFSRLCIIHFMRGEEYGDINEVQTELEINSNFLRPSTAVLNSELLSVKDDVVGERVVVYEGKSEFSGSFVVEDVTCEKELLRRLIFLNAPSVIQSEVTLIKEKKKGGKGKAPEFKPVPLSTKMNCEHHEVMAWTFGMLRYFFKVEDSAVQTLLLGLGGGLLVSFLKKFIPTTTVTAVEIDAEIVKVGQEYFGLPQDGADNKFNIVIDDALNFLKTNESEYHAILVDVDSKNVTEGLSCPPASFLEVSALESMKARLHPDGILALNLVCRNPTLRKELTTAVAAQFPFVYEYDVSEDLNAILFCFNRVPPGSSKTYLPTLVRCLNYIDDIQLPKKKVLPTGNSKKVKNGNGGGGAGGRGDGPSMDDIAELGKEASIEVKSRKLKLLRK